MSKDELFHEVFGENEDPARYHTDQVSFRQITHQGRKWFAAEDVAELCVSLGQYKTARHIRENCT